MSLHISVTICQHTDKVGKGLNYGLKLEPRNKNFKIESSKMLEKFNQAKLLRGFYTVNSSVCVLSYCNLCFTKKIKHRLGIFKKV